MFVTGFRGVKVFTLTLAMDSQVRQNFHADCEAAVNRMINLELHASYVYLSMVSFFKAASLNVRNLLG